MVKAAEVQPMVRVNCQGTADSWSGQGNPLKGGQGVAIGLRMGYSRGCQGN